MSYLIFALDLLVLLKTPLVAIWKRYKALILAIEAMLPTWLQRAHVQSSAKASKRGHDKRLLELQQAWEGIEGNPLLVACNAPLAQDTIYQRLPHIYVSIWTHLGEPKKDVQERFWKQIWPALKSQVKRPGAHHDYLKKSCFDEWLQAAIEAAIARPVEDLAGPFVPGPVPSLPRRRSTGLWVRVPLGLRFLGCF